MLDGLYKPLTALGRLIHTFYKKHLSYNNEFGAEKGLRLTYVRSGVIICTFSVAFGGERRNAPSLEIGKIVVENWCYLPLIYTFGEDAKIQETFSKKL